MNKVRRRKRVKGRIEGKRVYPVYADIFLVCYKVTMKRMRVHIKYDSVIVTYATVISPPLDIKKAMILLCFNEAA